MYVSDVDAARGAMIVSMLLFLVWFVYMVRTNGGWK